MVVYWTHVTQGVTTNLSTSLVSRDGGSFDVPCNLSVAAKRAGTCESDVLLASRFLVYRQEDSTLHLEFRILRYIVHYVELLLIKSAGASFRSSRSFMAEISA